MANIRSAKKRLRRATRQTAVNRARLSRVRTFIKNVETAIAGGDKEAAAAALAAAEPEMARSARRGVLPRNRIRRKLSRLSKRIKAV